MRLPVSMLNNGNKVSTVGSKSTTAPVIQLQAFGLILRTREGDDLSDVCYS